MNRTTINQFKIKIPIREEQIEFVDIAGDYDDDSLSGGKNDLQSRKTKVVERLILLLRSEDDGDDILNVAENFPWAHDPRLEKSRIKCCRMIMMMKFHQAMTYSEARRIKGRNISKIKELDSVIMMITTLPLAKKIPYVRSKAKRQKVIS